MSNHANDEPFIVRQNGDLLTSAEHLAWFEQCSKDALARGAVLARYSAHESIPNLILFESWDHHPASQGDLRWALVSKGAQP